MQVPSGTVRIVYDVNDPKGDLRKGRHVGDAGDDVRGGRVSILNWT